MASNPNNALSVSQDDAHLAALAATKNDMSQLTEEQRTQLYGAVCKTVGLNPLTSPFEYIKLNGKLTLYAKKGATDQIRETRGISITRIEKDVLDGVLMVTVHAADKNGRQDSDVGAVVIQGLRGDALANAYMKAITKAKRRVTLSLAGLGFMDESEVESVPGAATVTVNHMTGEIESRDPNNALGRLKAIAAEHDITEDMLELQAKSLGRTSIADFDAKTLNNTANAIQERPDQARDYYRNLVAESEEAQSEPVDAETGEVLPGTPGNFQSQLIDLPEEPSHAGHGDA